MDKRVIFESLVEQTNKFSFGLFNEIPIITADTHFTDLGLNSCDRAAIAADTLKLFSLSVPLIDILTASTLWEMAELIYQGTMVNKKIAC